MHANRDDFDSITKELRTKSEKIRALARQGAETADIARYLGIRYQHARNVLVASGLHQSVKGREVAEAGSRSASGDSVAWLNIDSLGRIQIPAAVMNAAGLSGDEPVYVRSGADGIEILSRRAALKRAHGIARRFVPDGASLVDDLIAERRRESELENG